MKPFTRQMLIGVVALILGAIPAFALAQDSGRDAAADQYGTVTSTTPTSTTPTSTTTTPTETTTTPTETTTPPPTTVGATVGATVTLPTPTPVTGAGDTTEQEPAPDEAGEAPDAEAGDQAPAPVTDRAGGPGAAADARGAGGAAGLGCGMRYAYIALGDTTRRLFLEAMEATGEPEYVSEIDVPLNKQEIVELTKGTEWAGAESDDKKLEDFGEAVGLAIPDAEPLARRALELLTDLTPEEIDPVLGIVLSHRPVSLDGKPKSAREAFVDGMIRGLRQVRVATTAPSVLIPFPIVGIEETDTKPSTIPWFKSREVPTVDNVETPVDQADKQNGKLSLLNVLAGTRGHFGTKKTAEDGEIAPAPDPRALVCRPDVTYRLGELLRVASGGVPGGGASIGILLLLGAVACFSLLALAERRTRHLRRHADTA